MKKIDLIIEALEPVMGADMLEAYYAARELHVINAKLLESLKTLIDMDVAYKRGDKVEQAVEAARAAITKAEVTK